MFKILKGKKKGFTLLEALVVLVIVSALVSVAVPAYLRATERVRADQSINTLYYIAGAQKAYKIKNHKYAEDASALSLTLRNLDGSDVSGTEFSDPYFHYVLHGDTEAKAVASRNNGEYSFIIDYATGQIRCEATSSSICSRYGVSNYAGNGSSGGSSSGGIVTCARKENAEYSVCVIPGSDGNNVSCHWNNKECFGKARYTGTVCDSSICETYENGEVVMQCDGTAGKCTYCQKGDCSEEHGTCTANEDLTGCASGSGCGAGENCASAPVCDKTGVCVGADANGTDFKCQYEDFECMSRTRYTGTLCPPESDICVAYEDGKNKLLCHIEGNTCEFCDGKNGCDAANGSCTPNATYTACAGESANIIQCSYDKETGYNICSGTNGNGKPFECGLKDYDCISAAHFTGTLCDEERSGCAMYEDGQRTMYCNSDGCYTCPNGKCVAKPFCTANAELTGCISNTGDANIMQCPWNEKAEAHLCTGTDDSDNPFECGYEDLECMSATHFTGTLCAEGKDKCYMYEKGQLTMSCSKGRGECFACSNGKCDTDNPLCTANADGTGCISNTGTSSDSGSGSDSGNTSSGPNILQCPWNEKAGAYICSGTGADGKPFECEIGNSGGCISDTHFTGTLCKEDGGHCEMYEDGQRTMGCNSDGCYTCSDGGCDKPFCTANAELTGCANNTGDANIIQCPWNEKAGTYICTGTGSDGKPFECAAGLLECISQTHFTGTLCTGNDGNERCLMYEDGQQTMYCDSEKCYAYHDGKCDETSFCTANADATGCISNTGTSSDSGSNNSGSGSSVNVINCDDNGCTGTGSNGKPFECAWNGTSCMSSTGYTGLLCDGKACHSYENGVGTYWCDRELNMCQSHNGDSFGGYCTANATYTGCAGATSAPKNLINCDKEGCIGENYQGQAFNCAANDSACMGKSGYTGTLCNNDACYNYEFGELQTKCFPSTNTCQDGGGYNCTSNAYNTGCAFRTIDCNSDNGRTCYAYEEDGTPVLDNKGNPISFANGDGDTMQTFAITGTICNDKGCASYENGIQTLTCKDGSQYCNIIKGDNEIGTCAAGDNGGCAYRTVQCDDKTCDVYQSGAPTGYSCIPGDISCYADSGVSGTFVKDKGVYVTMKNGIKTFECSSTVCYPIDPQTGETSSVGCTANATYSGCDK